MKNNKIDISVNNIVDFILSALFVYWANIELFFSRTLIFNYAVYAVTIVIFIIRGKLISRSHLLFLIIIILISLVNLSLPSNEYFVPYIFPFLIAGSIALLCVSMIVNLKGIIFWQFTLISIIAVVTFIDYSLSKGRGGSYWVTAYFLYDLFCLLLVYYIYIKRNTIILTTTIVLFVLILFTGARGAIISAIISFIISYIIYNKNISNKKPSNAIIILLILLTAGAVFNNGVIIILNKLSDYLGFSSRLLYLIDSDSLFQSQSRQIIYTTLFNNFINGDYFGSGFAAVPYLYHGALNTAHNFILELIAGFGILAIPVLYWFFKLIKDSIWKTNNNEYLLIGIYWLSIVIFPKMFSGTILTSQTIAMIGILITIKRRLINNGSKKNIIQHYNGML